MKELPESEQARKTTLIDKIYIFLFVLMILIFVCGGIQAFIDLPKY